MAESSLSPNVASPRELKRSYSAVESTGTGTAASIAALIVQRPSPESETLPAKLVSAGKVVAIKFRIAQRRRFGVDRALLLADISVAQNAHPFGVGGHDAVLDPVMDHLDEVTGTVRPAVQVAELGSAADALASGRARDIPRAGSERLEDRIEMPHGRIRSADHHAVSALQTPDAAAGSDIHVVDPFRRELLGAADVVHVVRIAAVDEDVAALAVRHEVG